MIGFDSRAAFCVQKLLVTGSTRALSNSPAVATHRASFFSLPILPILPTRPKARCRSLKQSARIECLTYISHDGSWSSRRLVSCRALEPDLPDSQKNRAQVRCFSASAGVDAFGSSVHEAEDGAQGFGAGIVKDIERRLPQYGGDFRDGLHPKALSATAYMIFASLAPCFAFGGSVTRLPCQVLLSFCGFASPFCHSQLRSSIWSAHLILSLVLVLLLIACSFSYCSHEVFFCHGSG